MEHVTADKSSCLSALVLTPGREMPFAVSQQSKTNARPPAIIVPLRASHVHPFSSINEPKMVLPTNHHSPCLSPSALSLPPLPSTLLNYWFSKWAIGIPHPPSLANNMYITLLLFLLLPPPHTSFLSPPWLKPLPLFLALYSHVEPLNSEINWFDIKMTP